MYGLRREIDRCSYPGNRNYHRTFIDNIKSIPSTSAGISSTLGNTRIRYQSSWVTDDVRAAMPGTIPMPMCTAIL